MIAIRNLTITEKRSEGQTLNVLNDINLTIYKNQKCVFFGEQASGINTLVNYFKGQEETKQGREVANGSIFLFDKTILDKKGNIAIDNKEKVSIASCHLNETITKSSITPRDLLRAISKDYNSFKKEVRKSFIKKLEERFTSFGVHNIYLREKFLDMKPIKAKKIFMAIMSLQKEIDLFIVDNVDSVEDILIVKEFLKHAQSTTIVLTNHPAGLSLGDKVYIFYAGEILEFGKPIDILYNSRHPYTWGIIESLPIPEVKTSTPLEGYLIEYTTNINSDVFSSRNSYALEIDFKNKPNYYYVSDQHYAKTWLLDKRAPKIKPPTNIVDKRRIYEKLKNETN